MNQKRYGSTEGMKEMEQTLGSDLAKFLVRSRRRGERRVVQSSEGAPTSNARIKRIQQELASTSFDSADM